MSSSQVVHIIDDDTDVLEALTFLLTAAGLAVQVHESAVAFLNARPRAQAGCIVTDIRMPGMDGLELQRKLPADHDDTPVILMTGHADVALAVEAMKGGPSAFSRSRSTTKFFPRPSRRHWLAGTESARASSVPPRFVVS